jgi:2-methylcitrate dehydratase PrpD
VLAAQLAAEGFTASPVAVEGQHGLGVVHSDIFDAGRPYEVMGEHLAIETISYKYHACAIGNRATVNGLSRVRAENDLDLAGVVEVRLYLPPFVLEVCGVEEPKSGAEGKFSVPYNAALALSGIGCGPASYTDAQVRDAGLNDLRQRILPVSDPGRTYDTLRVEIDFAGGRHFATEIDDRGAAAPATDDQLPRQWDRLSEKFLGLAEPVIGKAAAGDLHEAVRRLDELGSVTELVGHARRSAEG